uniref:Coronin-7 n=1 Tax=Dermatophagoides pteronyssinus TaxID=6956 RepID=A0A6P6XSP3_DERPT|nr:coronin-B-like isoform X1 [Dermatophagoides pteronyssinus]
MFSSINPWKNVECKISKKSFKYLNRYFQLPSFRTEKISHNLIATSGFLHSYRSSSNRIIVGSSWNFRESFKENGQNIDDKIDQHLLEIILRPNFDIIDLSFHPLNDDILAVSNSNSLQLLRLPVIPLDDFKTIQLNNKPNLLAKELNFEENISMDGFRFHPTMKEQLATNSIANQSISLYDINNIQNNPIAEWKCLNNEIVSSFNFNYVGQTIFANQINSKQSESIVSMIDLRSIGTNDTIRSQPIQCWQETHSQIISLDGQKSRPYILVSLLDRRKNNNLLIYDIRNFSQPILQHIECGSYRQNPSNIYLPCFDSDAGIVYLTLRNGQSIVHSIVDEMYLDSKRFNTFDNPKSYCTLPENCKPILDSTLMSKRSVNLNENQIDCLIILTTDGTLLPFSYYVPKKSSSSSSFNDSFSYKQFPATFSPHTNIDQKMFESKISLLNRINWLNLDPNKQNISEIYRFGENFPVEFDQYWSVNEQKIFQKFSGEIIDDTSDKPVENLTDDKIESKSSDDNINDDDNVSRLIDFNHLKYIDGSVYDRKLIPGMPSISQSRTLNFDFFHINEKYGIFVRSDRLNQISIKIIDSNGYDEHNGLGYINCPTEINCFALDPFNSDCLAIGLNDGLIQHFTITSDFYNNLIESNSTDMLMLEQPDFELNAITNDITLHHTSITSIQYHPMAKNILASSIDHFIMIWDLEQRFIQKIIDCSNNNNVLTLRMIQWNRFQNGCIYLAAFNEKYLMVKDVSDRQQTLNKNNDNMIVEFPNRINPNRLCWALNDNILLVTAKETSNRKILFYLFNENKLQYLFMHDMSSLPSFLTPYYDDDTRILYLAGRGENTVHFICLELNPSSKSNDVEQQCLSIKPLESYRFPTNHLAIDFLPRKQCCVRNCEIAIGIRMFMNGFERFRYRVPRNHPEYFHDEIYPPTADYSKPLFTSSKWLNQLKNPEQLSGIKYPLINLKPLDMIPFSTIREKLQEEQKQKRQQNNPIVNQRQNIANNNNSNGFPANFCQYFAHVDDEPLEISNNNCDDAEGVDPSEWVMNESISL